MWWIFRLSVWHFCVFAFFCFSISIYFFFFPSSFIFNLLFMVMSVTHLNRMCYLSIFIECLTVSVFVVHHKRKSFTRFYTFIHTHTHKQKHIKKVVTTYVILWQARKSIIWLLWKWKWERNKLIDIACTMHTSNTKR